MRQYLDCADDLLKNKNRPIPWDERRETMILGNSRDNIAAMGINIQFGIWKSINIMGDLGGNGDRNVTNLFHSADFIIVPILPYGNKPTRTRDEGGNNSCG
jgi:hypothetical protein